MVRIHFPPALSPLRTSFSGRKRGKVRGDDKGRSRDGEYLKRNRWLESGSLQWGVRCETTCPVVRASRNRQGVQRQPDRCPTPPGSAAGAGVDECRVSTVVRRHTASVRRYVIPLGAGLSRLQFRLDQLRGNRSPLLQGLSFKLLLPRSFWQSYTSE